MDRRFYVREAEAFSQSVRPLPMVSDWWEDQDPGFPLTVFVRERDGVRRTGWPVIFPLSLPPGILAGNDQTLVIEAEARSLPSQVEIMTRWPDGSAQHVRVRALVDVGPKAGIELAITGVRPADEAGVGVTDESGVFTVSTGPATFQVDGSGPRQIISAVRDGEEFITPKGQVACWAGRIRNAVSGNFRDVKQGSSIVTKVVEQGEVRTVIRKEAVLWQDDNPSRLVTWMEFVRGQPWVRLYTWTERDEARSHPMVAREVAFHGDFRYSGGLVKQCESRFGPTSEGEVVEATRAGGIVAQVVLPWLRELGMDSPTNLVRESQDDQLTVEWRPIDSGQEERSPMNSPCWVNRYWREAALVLANVEEESHLATALRSDLELRGIDVRCPGVAMADLAMQELLTIPAETSETVAGLAEGQSAARLSPDYPDDGVDGKEWHNWESAYFFGFGWRNIHFNQKKAFGPRAMKCDGLRLLQYEHLAHPDNGVADYDRQVRLQARAWPVNLAPKLQHWGFGYCDIGYFDRPRSRGQYPIEVAHTIPATTNVAYSGRLLFHLFEMWCRTGEPMLRENFEWLYEKSLQRLKEDILIFNGDRPWVFLRDLVRLYQFTEDPRFLHDLKDVMARLPAEMTAEGWCGNHQCRLWNSETYALIYRLLGEERQRQFHEGQVDTYLKEAQAEAVDETLLLPMARSLPTELRWGLLGSQVMAGYASSLAWDKSGHAEKWYQHFWQVVRDKLLVPSSVWGGLHFRLYTEDTCRSSTWFDRKAFAGTLSERGLGWDTDYAETNHASGEVLRGLTLFAASLLPYRYCLNRREIVFWVDPAKPDRAIAWPEGQLAVTGSNTDDFNLKVDFTAGTVSVLLPGKFQRSDQNGCDFAELIHMTGVPENRDVTVLCFDKPGAFSLQLVKALAEHEAADPTLIEA